MDPDPPARISLRNLELLFALGVSLLIIVLDVRYFVHAGGLWRDEVTSVNLAGKPSFLEVWQNNHLDSFPILFGTLLHAWIQLGPGGSDWSVRVLGLVIGLSAVGIYWWSVRSAGPRVPWALLVLLGLNPAMIAYGSEVRGYGIAVLTELAMFASFGLFVKEPTRKHGALAAAAALLCVQSLFANSVMLAAAGIAWGLVCLWRRQWKTLGLLVLFCLLAAASLLPYLQTFVRHREWFDIVRRDYPLVFYTNYFRVTLARAFPELPIVWPALFVCATLACLWRLLKPDSKAASATRDQALACLIALWLSPLLLFTYITVLKVHSALWYYLPLLALTAFCMDVGFDALIGNHAIGQFVRMAVALLLAVLTLTSAWNDSRARMTMVDLAAAAVETHAEPDDLVVVWPWYTACVFHRYYHGAAPWISLPDFDDKAWQAHPPIKEKMLQEHAVEAETQRIVATLKAGHRVWLVGGLAFLHPEQARRLAAQHKGPVPLPSGPVASQPDLWNHINYSFAWSREVAFLLQTHARIDPVSFNDAHPVRAEENGPVYVVSGWNGSLARGPGAAACRAIPL